MTTGSFDCYVSNDLVNYTNIGKVADKATLYGNTYYGGASIFKHDGIYYMFYTTYVSASSTDTIMCVATSDSVTGPYSQPKQTLLDEEVCGAKCAGAFAYKAPDGKTYLYWYKNISEYGNCIFGAELTFSDGFVTVDSSTVKMLIYPTDAWEKKEENGVSGRVCERPNVYYHNGYYYLFYAGSHWKTSYGEGYATSTSPLGDYVKYENNPILTTSDKVSGAGCTFIVPSPSGKQLYVVYHAHADFGVYTPRKIYLDKLIFVDCGDGADVAVILGPTVSEQYYPQ